jgi:hypothetical protein
MGKTGWHYHTQHPLELTNLMQGWGVNGPDDEESWQNMLPEYQNLLGTFLYMRANVHVLFLFLSSFFPLSLISLHILISLLFSFQSG